MAGERSRTHDDLRGAAAADLRAQGRRFLRGRAGHERERGLERPRGGVGIARHPGAEIRRNARAERHLRALAGVASDAVRSIFVLRLDGIGIGDRVLPRLYAALSPLLQSAGLATRTIARRADVDRAG